MEMIKRRAYARAGLVGNPSDGYNGKTIAVSVRNFYAEVVLYEWDSLELLPSEGDQSNFASIDDLYRDVQVHGYYGGLRLVKAAIKKFAEYCKEQEHPLHGRNFSIRYETTIPRQVGLGGSSAIIVATLRALMAFYKVEIPKEIQPSLALSVETGELSIAAGLQDRVIQVYEGAVFMDFSQEVKGEKCGYDYYMYEPIDPAKLPPLYVAYSVDEGQDSGVLHGSLRRRYNNKEQEVVQGMKSFAALAQRARDALVSEQSTLLAEIINANFSLRDGICKNERGESELKAEHKRMVKTAQRVGVSAKYAGSGGAIIGTYKDADEFERLQEALGAIKCQVIKPIIKDIRPV